jgi:hypothetical protein
MNWRMKRASSWLAPFAALYGPLTDATTALPIACLLAESPRTTGGLKTVTQARSNSIKASETVFTYNPNAVAAAADTEKEFQKNGDLRN